MALHSSQKVVCCMYAPFLGVCGAGDRTQGLALCQLSHTPALSAAPGMAVEQHPRPASVGTGVGREARLCWWCVQPHSEAQGSSAGGLGIWAQASTVPLGYLIEVSLLPQAPRTELTTCTWSVILTHRRGTATVARGLLGVILAPTVQAQPLPAGPSAPVSSFCWSVALRPPTA